MNIARATFATLHEIRNFLKQLSFDSINGRSNYKVSDTSSHPGSILLAYLASQSSVKEKSILLAFSSRMADQEAISPR